MKNSKMCHFSLLNDTTVNLLPLDWDWLSDNTHQIVETLIKEVAIADRWTSDCCEFDWHTATTSTLTNMIRTGVVTIVGRSASRVVGSQLEKGLVAAMKQQGKAPVMQIAVSRGMSTRSKLNSATQNEEENFFLGKDNTLKVSWSAFRIYKKYCGCRSQLWISNRCCYFLLMTYTHIYIDFSFNLISNKQIDFMDWHLWTQL